jgi:hypothetical protein
MSTVLHTGKRLAVSYWRFWMRMNEMTMFAALEWFVSLLSRQSVPVEYVPWIVGYGVRGGGRRWELRRTRS